jgi:hypothetical protein
LLLIGSGALADTLLNQLGGQDVVVEHAARGDEAASERAPAPELIVLAGDAAHDRGAAVIARLPQMKGKAPVPVLVLCAPESDGASPEPAQRHVGFLSPEGGIGECTRRVRVVIELFMEVGLGACSLQQLTDTAAPRPKPSRSATGPSPAAAPKHTPTMSHTPVSIRSAIASANRAATAARPAAARPSRLPPPQAAAAMPALEQPRLPSASSATRASTTPAIAPEPTARQPRSLAQATPPATQPAQRVQLAPSENPTNAALASSAPEHALHTPPPIASAPIPECDAAPSAQSSTIATPTASSASEAPLESPPVAAATNARLAEPASVCAVIATAALVPTLILEQTPGSPPTNSPVDPETDETELTTVFWSAAALSHIDSAAKMAAGAAAKSEATTSAPIADPTSVESPADSGVPLSERPTSPPESLSPLADVTEEPTIVRVLNVFSAQVQTAAAVPNLVVARPEPAPTALALNAPVAQQPIAHPPVALRVHGSSTALEAPSSQQSARQPSLATARASRSSDATRKRRAVLLYAVAALGCTALLLCWLYAAMDRSEGAAVAAGALHHASSAETTPSTAQVVAPPSLPVPSPPVDSRQVDSSSNPIRAGGHGGKLARAQALIDEGTVLLNQGELGLAQGLLQQALEAIPEHPKAMALLARVHLARRDGAEAMRWAHRLLAKYPRNDAFQVLLGDAQALSGDIRAARTTWTEAARNGSSAARRRLQ